MAANVGNVCTIFNNFAHKINNLIGNMDNNYCVSVDWLSVFGVVRTEHFEYGQREGFKVEPVGHGSKIWRELYRVFLEEDKGKWRPFASLGMKPWFERTESEDVRGGLTGDTFLLRVENKALYETDWLAHLVNFMNEWGLYYTSLSRADIAVDFCQLKNHVTGKKIIRMLKTLQWWKAGQNKVVEVYRFPYHIKRCPDGSLDDGWGVDNSQWMTLKEEDSLTESITFGTHGSICQVQLYDKTKELERVTMDGVCAKEYIRTRWQETGILKEGHHVWRLEFRLSSKADCVCNRSLGYGYGQCDFKVLRKLTIWDLDADNLPWTFLCVQNHWFKLLDATQGGVVKTIDAEYIRKMRTHKGRLPVVRLFDSYESMTFKTHKYKENPSRWAKILLNALNQRATMIENGLLQGNEYDVERLRNGADAIRDVYLKRGGDGLNNDNIDAWKWLGLLIDAEEVPECEFEQNLQMDLFNDTL